jgi:hypothetical protein
VVGDWTDLVTIICCKDVEEFDYVLLGKIQLVDGIEKTLSMIYAFSSGRYLYTCSFVKSKVWNSRIRLPSSWRSASLNAVNDSEVAKCISASMSSPLTYFVKYVVASFCANNSCIL